MMIRQNLILRIKDYDRCLYEMIINDSYKTFKIELSKNIRACFLAKMPRGVKICEK